LLKPPEFTKQLETLGDIRELDESLRALMWGIQTQAEKFQLVPGFRTLRMAKEWNLKLRIIFQIQGGQVLLKWIERIDEPGIFDNDDE